MKLGLIADVRGAIEALDHALAIVDAEGCHRVACLGSTVEGGPDDALVLERLRQRDAIIVRSPHDAPGSLDSASAEASGAGLVMAHSLPAAPDEILWLNACPAPGVLLARELLADGTRRAFGDAYAPLVLLATPDGVRRRLFLGAGRLSAPGAFIACPGSLAIAGDSPLGGCLMTWDDEAAVLEAIPFDASGARLPERPPRILIYCVDLGAHRPDADALARGLVEERPSADDVVGDVTDFRPDVVLMDYHLAGKHSGMDAILALRVAGLSVPVLSISGNPADSEGMKAAGAVGGLAHSYLKDVITRLILETSGYD